MHSNPAPMLVTDIGHAVRDERYDVEVIDTRDALQAAIPEWRELLASNVRNGDIFSDPAMVESAVGDKSTSPYIVLVRRQGALVCVAPFAIRQSQFAIRFSVFRLVELSLRQMNLFGNDFVYAEGADFRKCCSLVFAAIQQAECDLTVLYSLDAQSPLWAYCDGPNDRPRGLRFVRPCRHFDKRFALELPQTFAEYVGELGSSTRSSLRRRTKKLLNEHSAKLTRIDAAKQIPTFLAAVTEIYKDAWQSKTYGGAKRDQPSEIERLQRIARHGWLQCYLLESDLGPLAFQYGYLYRNTYFACDFAFARQRASLGPGSVLMYLMLEDLCTNSRLRHVDLGAGDSPQKHTFRGIPRDVADYWVIPHNRLRIAVPMQRGLERVESATRAFFVRTGLDKPIRRLLKHKR